MQSISLPAGPHYVFCHSTGGMVTLLALNKGLAKQWEKLKGVVYSAPLIKRLGQRSRGMLTPWTLDRSPPPFVSLPLRSDVVSAMSFVKQLSMKDQGEPECLLSLSESTVIGLQKQVSTNCRTSIHTSTNIHVWQHDLRMCDILNILLRIGEPVTLPFPQVTFAPCNWARKEPGELSNGRRWGNSQFRHKR